MSEIDRRSFVKSSAGAAAGMTAIGSLVLVNRAQADSHVPAGSDPVVAYLRDPSNGEISLMVGDREVTVHDQALAARIARAAG